MMIPRCSVESEAVAAHYDELDFFHREVWGAHLHHGFWETGRESIEAATRRLSLKAIESLELRPGERVIDVGSGYGFTCRMLADEFGGAVTGYTLSELQHRWASVNHDGLGIRFRRGDWLTNGEKAESADAVISIECVSHLVDKAAFFAEIARILKPGGRCVVCGWLVRPGLSRRVSRWLIEPLCRAGQMPGIGTADDYRKLIADAGLQRDGEEDISRKVRRTWRLICWKVFRMALTKRKFRRRLLRCGGQNFGRGATLLRVMAAYYGGWMGYGFFVMRKPLPNESASNRGPRFSEENEPGSASP